MICGTLFSDGHVGPVDKEGCHLVIGHVGPHEFVATDGATYQWESDLECEPCTCDGDWCSVYWPVAAPQTKEQP